jgi:hypothetical protein
MRVSLRVAVWLELTPTNATAATVAVHATAAVAFFQFVEETVFVSCSMESIFKFVFVVVEKCL